MKKKNPISPHLTIYKPQISSVLSILHRMTGAYLFCGIIFVSWLMVGLIMQGIGFAFEGFDLFLLLDSLIFKLFILGLAFCLYYHLLNGIRHLCWDMGFGFEKKAMNASGMLVVALSLSLSILTVILALARRF